MTWILISILIVTVAVGIVVALIARRKKLRGEYRETNYRTFFAIGLVLLPMGIALMIASLLLDWSFVVAMPLLSVGATYLAIGWTHRGKQKT